MHLTDAVTMTSPQGGGHDNQSDVSYESQGSSSQSTDVFAKPWPPSAEDPSRCASYNRVE
jgi:hypothetical protein